VHIRAPIRHQPGSRSATTRLVGRLNRGQDDPAHPFPATAAASASATIAEYTAYAANERERSYCKLCEGSCRRGSQTISRPCPFPVADRSRRSPHGAECGGARVFLVLAAKAPARVWKVHRSSRGVITRLEVVRPRLGLRRHRVPARAGPAATASRRPHHRLPERILLRTRPHRPRWSAGHRSRLPPAPAA
jgi:hypothetical protein